MTCHIIEASDEALSAAVEARTLNGAMMFGLEQIALCQASHIEEAIKHMHAGNYADAMHELADGRTHLSTARVAMKVLEERYTRAFDQVGEALKDTANEKRVEAGEGADIAADFLKKVAK